LEVTQDLPLAVIHPTNDLRHAVNDGDADPEKAPPK
jgi:hypothetical protein